MTIWDADSYDLIMTNERNGYSIFDADYTPSPEAIAQVNRVFDYIEENPEKWDQEFYGNENSDKNCFMGILCRLNGLTRPATYGDYALFQAMDILGMDGDNHEDRANYIALFVDVRNSHGGWRELTLKDMRERVSIAMNHDFRTELSCGCVPHKTRMTDFGLYCDTEQQGYCNFECPHEDES